MNYYRDTAEGRAFWDRRVALVGQARRMEAEYGLSMWYDGADAPDPYKVLLFDFERLQQEDERAIRTWAAVQLKEAIPEIQRFVAEHGGSVTLTMLRTRCPGLKNICATLRPEVFRDLPGLALVSAGAGYRLVEEGK